MSVNNNNIPVSSIASQIIGSTGAPTGKAAVERAQNVSALVDGSRAAQSPSGNTLQAIAEHL